MTKLLTALVSALIVLSGPALAETYRVSGSGAAQASSDADLNGDMQGGSIGTTTASGSGATSGSTRSDLLPWNGIDFCDFDPQTGFPRGVLLQYFAQTTIDTFSNGDQLYRQMDTAPPSTLCFNFIDNASFTFEIHSVAVGGSGRYENATGSFVTTGSGKTIGPGHSAFRFEVEGTIDR